MLIFWVTGPHTGRIVTQWRYCKQSNDWRGQTYPQPLLLCSEISLFWRTSCARDFFYIVEWCGRMQRRTEKIQVASFHIRGPSATKNCVKIPRHFGFYKNWDLYSSFLTFQSSNWLNQGRNLEAKLVKSCIPGGYYYSHWDPASYCQKAGLITNEWLWRCFYKTLSSFSHFFFSKFMQVLLTQDFF